MNFMDDNALLANGLGLPAPAPVQQLYLDPLLAAITGVSAVPAHGTPCCPSCQVALVVLPCRQGHSLTVNWHGSLGGGLVAWCACGNHCAIYTRCPACQGAFVVDAIPVTPGGWDLQVVVRPLRPEEAPVLVGQLWHGRRETLRQVRQQLAVLGLSTAEVDQELRNFEQRALQAFALLAGGAANAGQAVSQELAALPPPRQAPDWDWPPLH